LLAELSRIADRQGIDNVTTRRGDARSLSTLLPERVGTVLVANTFHGVADRVEFVREVADAIRPGGTFAVVNWRPLDRTATTVGGEPCGPPTDLRLSPDETAEIVIDAADFAELERVDLPPYHYATRFERR
jgi:SAM-dependent methyltransferase